jgi:hypothetical protein
MVVIIFECLICFITLAWQDLWWWWLKHPVAACFWILFKLLQILLIEDLYGIRRASTYCKYIVMVCCLSVKSPYFLLYFRISLPAMFLCAGLSTFLGSAMLFATGVVYGLMALGKK